MRTAKEIIHKNGLPLLIVLSGIILRVVISFIWGYSNDELSAISRSFYANFDTLVDKGVMETDMHPVGVQFFITFWQNIFGTDAWIMRLPFIIVSGMGLYLFYLFFKPLFGKQVSITFLVLSNFLYFFIPHTLFARPYAFALFFTGLALYGVKLLLDQNTPQWKSVLILTLGWSGILHSHYFAALFAGWLALCLLLLIPVKKWLPFLLSGVFAGLLFLPHLGITLHHLDQGGLGWLPPPEFDFLFDFLFHLSNESWWLSGFFLILLLGGIYFTLRNDTQSTWKILSWSLFVFIGIYVIGYYYSVNYTPILKFMVLLFPAPFLLIFVSHLISWPIKTLQKGYYVLLFLVIFSSSIWSMQLFNPTVHFGVFRELAIHTAKWGEHYGSENITKVTNLHAPYYLDFYLQQYGSDIKDFKIDYLEFDDHGNLDSLIAVAKTPYFLYSYSNHDHLSAYHEKIRKKFPSLIEGHQYFNSGIWLYKNEPTERKFKTVYDYPAPEQLKDSSGWYILPAQGFTPAVSFDYNELNCERYDYLLYETKAYLPENSSLILVGVGEENGQPIQKSGNEYYRAVGSDGKTGKHQLFHAFDIATEWLSDQSKITFYLWNNGNKPVYVKDITLKLVDPEL